MRNAIRVLGVVAALALCAASATSYRESYTDTSLGGGRWLVSVKVTSRTGMGEAQRYAYQRAAEVCGGRGFDVLDGDSNTDSRPIAITSTQGASSGTARANCTSSTYGGTTCQGTYSGASRGTSTTSVIDVGSHDVTLYYQCRGANVGGAAQTGRARGSLFDGQ